jgi:hypothetical protein
MFETHDTPLDRRARPATVEGMTPMSAMLARRAGRAAFGVGLLAGACAIVSSAIASHQIHAVHIIGVTWAASITAGLLVWLGARLLAHRWHGDTLKYAGLVLPAVGLALIAPLTTHLLVTLPFGLGLRSFDDWTQISLVVTGAAHIAFAVTSAYRVVGLIDGTRVLSVQWVFLIVILVSCVPFVVLIVPPILVALTGLAMLPILFAPETIVARERAIANATPARAVVVQRASTLGVR